MVRIVCCVIVFPNLHSLLLPPVSFSFPLLPSIPLSLSSSPSLSLSLPLSVLFSPLPPPSPNRRKSMARTLSQIQISNESAKSQMEDAGKEAELFKRGGVGHIIVPALMIPFDVIDDRYD